MKSVVRQNQPPVVVLIRLFTAIKAKKYPWTRPEVYFEPSCEGTVVDSHVRNPDRAQQLGYRKQEKQVSHPVGTVIVTRTGL